MLSSRRSQIPARPPPTRAAKATNSSLQPASGWVVLRSAGAAPGSAASPSAAPCSSSCVAKVDRGRGIPLSGMPFGPSDRRHRNHVAVAVVVDHPWRQVSHCLPYNMLCYVMLSICPPQKRWARGLFCRWALGFFIDRNRCRPMDTELIQGVASLLHSAECADLQLVLADGSIVFAHSVVLFLRCPKLLQALLPNAGAAGRAPSPVHLDRAEQSAAPWCQVHRRMRLPRGRRSRPSPRCRRN